MSNTQDSVWPHFKMPQSLLKYCGWCPVLTLLCVFGNVINHSLSCLIYHLKATHFISHVLMLCILFLVNLDDGKKKWFLEFYKRMCNCGNPNKNNRVGSVTLALQVWKKSIICSSTELLLRTESTKYGIKRNVWTVVIFISCSFQSSVLSGATIDDDPEAECRRCCAFNFPVSSSMMPSILHLLFTFPTIFTIHSFTAYFPFSPLSHPMSLSLPSPSFQCRVHYYGFGGCLPPRH